MYQQKLLFLLVKHSRFGSMKVILLMGCSSLLILYFFSERKFNDLEHLKFYSFKNTDTVDGYLVWNKKCHLPSKNPFDPSVVKFIKKEQYEKCTNSSLLTAIIHNPNKTDTLILNVNETKHLKNIFCCWTPIFRAPPNKAKLKKNFDSLITVGNCTGFKNSIILPKEVEIVMVSCINEEKKEIYKNIHSVLTVEKVANRLNNSKIGKNKDQQRKLSILFLGIDSVSRLSLIRNLPKTVNYLDNQGWLNLKGYTKMAINTFPNLMAILTGQEEYVSFTKCNPKLPYGLDHCPMIWYNYRRAGFITAFAEDEFAMNTFNWMKVGFVDPPTDYYLRPYTIATETLLKTRKKYGRIYCSGPETVIERILNSAVDFVTRFKGHPYFGFFWSNAVSHDSTNGISSMDSQILSRFKQLEKEGVTNESMIIFISDHGIRTGEIRQTFIGWYEERLPFFYIWLPEWFRKANPEVYQALSINQNRLTSPFDLYETFRDILIRAGGAAEQSPSCPKCMSLFKTIPSERGCADAGVPVHWCVCTGFENVNISSKIVIEGAQKLVDHMENIVKNYKATNGTRLCAKFKLKEIQKSAKVIGDPTSTSAVNYFYNIEVTPGGARFAATVSYHGFGNYSIREVEINRLDSYEKSSRCLTWGLKQYCHCIT